MINEENLFNNLNNFLTKIDKYCENKSPEYKLAFGNGYAQAEHDIRNRINKLIENLKNGKFPESGNLYKEMLSVIDEYENI